jgi:predicted metal-dependent hydrolase
VTRRNRETLEIAVEPDTSVAVVAPIGASDDAVRAKVKKRASWILQQQKYFAQFSPRSVKRRYISGETHLYLGRQYRLKVTKADISCVKLMRGCIVVETTDPHDVSETERLLNAWYQAKALAKFSERLDICQQRFSRPNRVEPSGLTIRLMEKRWGMMSHQKRLTLNRRLIQASVVSIDYVITHELCHIVIPNHKPAFYRLLQRVMGDWQMRKQRLEKLLV